MYQIVLVTDIGSTLYGTTQGDGKQDQDLLAVVVENTDNFLGFKTQDIWTFRTQPEGIKSTPGDIDWVGYGLKKYLGLALRGNPNTLLPLFASGHNVKRTSQTGKDLQALAPHIVSKEVFHSFTGYMRHQHQKLTGDLGQHNVTRPELVEKYGYDTKYAYHIVRLGLQGEEILLTGGMSLPMKDADRALCVEVRNGKFTLEQFGDLMKDLNSRLLWAYKVSSLPEKPNYDLVEKWMTKTYLDFWSQNV